MTTRRTHRTPAKFIALTLLGLFCAQASPALACGGAWFPELLEREPDRRPLLIPMAEKALEEGRPIAAAGLVIRVIPHIRTLKPGSAKIVERAQRVLALALARNDGALALAQEVPDYALGSWLGTTDTARHANLQWSVSTLRAVSEATPNDPTRETELAEAMAKLPELRAEARAKLEKLAERDLLPSAEGYKTLAALRAAGGDHAGEKLALTRCAAMTKLPGLCRAPASSAS